MNSEGVDLMSGRRLSQRLLVGGKSVFGCAHTRKNCSDTSAPLMALAAALVLMFHKKRQNPLKQELDNQGAVTEIMWDGHTKPTSMFNMEIIRRTVWQLRGNQHRMKWTREGGERSGEPWDPFHRHPFDEAASPGWRRTCSAGPGCSRLRRTGPAAWGHASGGFMHDGETGTPWQIPGESAERKTGTAREGRHLKSDNGIHLEGSITTLGSGRRTSSLGDPRSIRSSFVHSDCKWRGDL